MDDTLLGMAPLAIFMLGALIFSVLTVVYWGERRRNRPGRGGVFPVFTLVCAAAFLDNLLYQGLFLRGGDSFLGMPVMLVRVLTTGLLPPLMLHVVFETESPRAARRFWYGFLAACYAGGLAFPLLRVLNETDLVSVPGSDLLYSAPAAILGVAGAGGLLLQAVSPRRLAPGERAHRHWIRAVLILMVACAAAALSGWGALVGQVPDYLVLAFFSVSLYYRERLVFFDLLVKRGAFLALGLAMVALCFAIRPPSQWIPWAYGLGLLAFWLLGSWVYPHVARLIDHTWLRRPYTAADAERQFIREIQAASGEEELQSRAAASLSAIFQAPAEVRFSPAAVAATGDGLSAELEKNGGSPTGGILLAPRPSGIPFLSDDRRLLQSLSGTLSVVLENVRFRADLRRQEEREQQLRLLATRAELKALRAQINPHFLFNALSVIAGLIQYQPELADETIEQLAQVFRYTLRKSQNEWSPLAEEVDFVASYLRVEQARFGKRLRVEFSVDPLASQVSIPAMCIQPLIENAIKHGVSAMAEGGAVGLRASLEGERLSVEVSDSGPGFPADFTLEGPGEGHGLRNVAERLRGYYGDSARLSWESGAGGTRVVLAVPRSAARAAAAEMDAA